MFPVMVFGKPEVKGSVYIFQSGAGKCWEKLSAYGFEEPFDLPLPLGLIRLCMYKCNTQCGGCIFKLAGAECRAVIDIELSGKTPFGHGGSKGIHEGNYCLGEVKLPVRYQAGMVIDKGDQVAFALFVALSLIHI